MGVGWIGGRKELVSITGQIIHMHIKTNGEVELLVERQEVREEWMWPPVEEEDK